MIRGIIIIVLVLLSVNAQSQRYAFVSYSTSEGLPQSQVNAIAQDNQGYLWIGTFGGLTRFNGKEFINYTKSDGLINNRVTHLRFISDTLYIGHNNGISIKTDDENETFSVFEFPANTLSSNVTEIISFNHQIYISTNGQGLFRLTPTELIAIEHSPERIRGMTVVQNKLLLATREGLHEYHNESFQQLEVFQDFSYSSIHQLNNTIFLTTFDGKLLESTFPFESVRLKYESPTLKFRGGYLISENEIWLNASDGALKVSKNERIEINENSGLPINDVNVVFEDREKNIWFGTSGKGLQLFSGETFTHFNTKSGLPSELIISSLETKEKEFWLSSFDKGVFKFSPKNPTKTIMIDEIENIVWSSESSNEQLFFGSTYGLYIYNEKQNDWTTYYETDGLPGNKITGLYAINENAVLIGTSLGVAIYEDGEIRPLLPDNIQIQNVRDFANLGDSVYFAGQKGVYAWFNEQLEKIVEVDGGTNSLAVDAHKNLWIGTENGLFVMKKDSVINVLLEGKSGASYINFVKHHNNIIYAGTNHGLYEVDINNLNIIHHGISEGLVDLETNLNSASIDSENNLWFGTVAGLMKMNLSKKRKWNDTIRPLLHITKVLVNFQQSKHLKKIDTKSFLLPNLNYNQNNLTFHFDGIFLSNPNGLSYKFQLEGVSDDWSPASKSNTLNFTNLPAGQHQLKIKVFIDENEENNDTLLVNFSITPPFYLTWWFYGIVFIVIVSVLLIIDYYRSLRLKRLNYQEKLEFQNKLVQLEQQSLNASMNRHFIFNSLNSIQYYINSSDKQSANRYLTRFAKLIRKNLDSSSSKNGMVSLQDELERLTLYLDLETMRFRGKFDFTIDIDDTVETETLMVPAMFLQPFVENSLIHGILPLKNKKGKIEINITDHLEDVRIEIKDNGVGIDTSRKIKTDEDSDHDSRGMLITKGRIDLLQKASAKSIELIGPHQITGKDHSINGTIVTFKLLKQYLSN